MTSAAQPEFEPSGMAALRTAWQNAFCRTSIGLNENFFQLGGDASRAAALFSEISHALGREVSPVLILQAPTIASLYAVLQRPGPFVLPAITPLRSGDNKLPPVLLFHGCGGTVLDLVKLANSVQVPNSVYGFQNPGADGLAEPFERIEDIAEYHCRAIKQQEIKGPYFLIGYSAGGLIALELANRLKELGGKIPLLTMIDSFPPLSVLPRHRVLGVKLRREAHRWAVSARRLLALREHSQGKTANPAGHLLIAGDSMRRFRQAELHALEGYRGRSYNAPIKFIRAKASWTFPLNPRTVWSSFIPDMTIETTPGDHVGLLGAHCGELGRLLSRYIHAELPNLSEADQN